MNGSNDFFSKTRIEVGSGSKTLFWKDRWCSNRPLAEEVPLIFCLTSMPTTKVNDFWIQEGTNGAWNVNLCRQLNDWELLEMESLIDLIQPIIPRMEMEDRLIWIPFKNGIFSVKSSREAVWMDKVPGGSRNHMWKLAILSKFTFFL